jgi:hypothetical protein
VPQSPYKCGNTQKHWVPKPPILFFTRGYIGVNLYNALEGMFEGVEERDEHPFDATCQGITIRVHVGSYCHWVSDNSSSCSQFPGYPSSTDVEKLLKRRGGDKARTMQVRE